MSRRSPAACETGEIALCRYQACEWILPAEGGEKNITSVRELSGKAFDKAYIDHEVAHLEQVISALDTLLIRTPRTPN